MSLSNYLAIVGVIVSVLFGAWGIFLTVRHRYPGEITFVRELSIALFVAIVKDLPDLAILYKNAPISRSVVLLKGSLVNTGRKDISSSMVQTPVTFDLPEGSRWLSASVVSTSPAMSISLEFPAPNKISLVMPLLRCNEFVRLQALAELNEVPKQSGSTSARLNKSLKISHRIEDTGAVRMTDLRSDKPIRWRRVPLYTAMLVIGLTLSVILVANILGVQNRFAYDLSTDTGQVVRVAVSRMSDNSVHVRAIDGSRFRRSTGMDEFFSRIDGKRPVIVRDRAQFLEMFVPVCLLYVVLPSLLLGMRLRHYWAQKRLRRTIDLD